MTQPTVYLAGPITGLSYDNAQDWRTTVADQLRPIRCLSPLRGKQYLRDLKGGISGTGEEYAHLGPLSLPRGVMARDRWDATRCDVLFVNLLGATRVSIGTVMEIAWADLQRTPIVCCMEPGNVHEHMVVAEAVNFRVDRLSDACDIVRSLLDVATDPPATEWPAEPVDPDKEGPKPGEMVAVDVAVAGIRSYGYCPQCWAPGLSRERRPNGNDTCENGHRYKSAEALFSSPNMTGGAFIGLNR